MLTLTEVYKNCNSLTDKGTDHNYLETYEKLFADKADKPVTLLEVGYYEGESAVLWSNYFTHPQSTFDFIDLKKPSNNFSNLTKCYNKNRIKFHIQDINGIEKNSYFDKKYDIVIDDGSHCAKDQQATIQYFKDKLKPNGILVIEDVRKDPTRWGDPSTLNEIVDLLPFKVYDLRHITGRFDDILLVYKKP